MRTVVITGAASGIGAATERRLAADGDRVLSVDVRDADVVADLGTPEGRQRAVDGVAQRCDSIDGLVTCAGIGGYPGRSGATVVSIDYFGTVAFLDGLRAVLARSDAPAAVAISSNSTTIHPGVSDELVEACLADDEPRSRAIAERVGAVAAYPAAKLAIARWVRRKAPTEPWAGAGVRLNALAPGMVETPLVAEGRRDPKMAPLLEQLPIPVGGPGTADQIAAFIHFLLGPDARYLCGSVLFVDGGTDALLRADDWPAAWPVR